MACYGEGGNRYAAVGDCVEDGTDGGAERCSRGEDIVDKEDMSISEAFGATHAE